MIESIESYKKMVVKALKAANKYNKSLDIQIASLASAMRSRDMCNAEIDSLDKTYVFEVTRYGERMVPHPVFKVLHSSLDRIEKYGKALGLTAADLGEELGEDPMVELTKKVRNAGQAKIIKPKD